MTSDSTLRSSTSGWLTSCDGAGEQRGAAAAAAVAVVVAAAAVVAAAGRQQTEMLVADEQLLRQLLLTVGLTGAKQQPGTKKVEFKVIKLLKGLFLVWLDTTVKF